MQVYALNSFRKTKILSEMIQLRIKNDG